MDSAHPSVLAVAAWLQSLAPFARLHEEAEIEELMDAAESGLLWDSGDETASIKPIHADPEVFELRRTALNEKLRFYHGEPAELPAHLVALHKHIKLDKATQQAEIEHAVDRYDNGRPAGWV